MSLFSLTPAARSLARCALSLSEMEKKETHNSTNTTTAAITTTKPGGSMCERLFNALNTNNTFRPLRRLTIPQQDSEPQSETQSNNLPATAVTTNAKHKTPSPPPHQEKPKVAFNTPPVAKNDAKGTDKKDAPFVAKKDHKGTEHNAIPVPVPPKGAIAPHPVPPSGVTDTANTKPRKSLNEKVEEYINRTKGKLRTGSTLGRTQTTK